MGGKGKVERRAIAGLRAGGHYDGSRCVFAPLVLYGGRIPDRQSSSLLFPPLSPQSPRCTDHQHHHSNYFKPSASHEPHFSSNGPVHPSTNSSCFLFLPPSSDLLPHYPSLNHSQHQIARAVIRCVLFDSEHELGSCS